MQGTELRADPLTGEIITIPLTGEDELADIPAEMREVVAAEIAAFRQRSTERDMDRLRREKEAEAAEKRNGRANRLGSPPRSAPTGPSATNGIPLGPRGAPTGPKGHQGGQNGVNGSNVVTFSYVTPDEEDSDASDEELERRRIEKREADDEKNYLDLERKWLNRERSRTAAVDREKTRDQVESSVHDREKDSMSRRMREFKDDSESFRRSEDFYRDRNSWLRSRQATLKREKKADDEDRAQEAREKARDSDRSDRSRPSQIAPVVSRPEDFRLEARDRDQPRFKISLGAAAQRAQAAVPRRTVAEVEGLLEDEEEEAPTAKRTLIPIKFDTAAEAAGLTEEERAQAIKLLAAEIPTNKDDLWTWDMKWEYVDDSIMQDQIRPFVEKKMVEYLGVQEEMLVDMVEEHIKQKGSPQELIKELEGVSNNIAFDQMLTL
jgi:PWI domain